MIPADPPVPSANSAVNLQDSVIGGDVTIHQADAKEIAIAIDDVGRCPCGNTATAIYESESTNCGSKICFLCMQKYIHGRTIIPHKFCEPHYYSEVECIGLDRDFQGWEKKMSTTLSIISIMKMLIKSAPTLKALSIVMGLITLSGGVYYLLSGPVPDITTDEAFMLVTMGPVLCLGGFLWGPMFSASASGAEKALETLLGKMPNNNPPDRPELPGRELPIFTLRVVENYFSME